MKFRLPFRRVAIVIKAHAIERRIDACDEDIIVHGQCALMAERRRGALERRLGSLRHELARERVA